MNNREMEKKKLNEEELEMAIYQLMVDIFKFPRFFYPDLLMALA